MDLLLILTYAAICYAIFKLFKIPVNATRYSQRRWEVSFCSASSCWR